MPKPNKRFFIRIYYGMTAMGQWGVLVESLTGENLDTAKKSIHIDPNISKYKIAAQVSLIAYELFIQEYFRQVPSKFKKEAAKRIKSVDSFKKLFWRIWWRK